MFGGGVSPRPHWIKPWSPKNFELCDAIKIRGELLFVFYPGLPHSYQPYLVTNCHSTKYMHHSTKYMHHSTKYMHHSRVMGILGTWIHSYPSKCYGENMSPSGAVRQSFVTSLYGIRRTHIKKDQKKIASF